MHIDTCVRAARNPPAAPWVISPLEKLHRKLCSALQSIACHQYPSCWAEDTPASTGNDIVALQGAWTVRGLAEPNASLLWYTCPLFQYGVEVSVAVLRPIQYELRSMNPACR